MNSRTSKNKLISFIIPCFNEVLVLDHLYERVNAVACSWEYNYEVICVDDGSSDDTLRVLKTFCEKNKNWKFLSLSRNFGHQTALSCGLEHSQGDAVIVMDADLQDPPEELYRFIEKWESGYEVVFAIRKKRKENMLKRFCYAVFYRVMAKMVSFEIPLDSGDFCLMDRKVVDTLKSMPERNRFVRGLRAWAGFKQVGVEYERSERYAGTSHYTLSKLFKLAADGLISFSGFPLRISAYFGLLISGFSLLGIFFTLFQRIFISYFESIGLAPVPGFTTIVIAVLFLGGVQLMFLGVIGEYLYRIFQEVKSRPLWIVRESSEF